jgi:branched-chain amino acid transport system permease protein
MAILACFILLVGFLLHRFDHSRLGRAASTVFLDKELAASLGVDVRKLGMLLQTVSCTIAGGTGVLYGFIYKSFHPDFFTFALVGIAMTVIFVGGYATPWGTVVVAPILYGVPLLFPPSIQEWRIVIYGALLVLVLVLKPEGFITRRFVVSIETFLSGIRKKRNIL